MRGFRQIRASKIYMVRLNKISIFVLWLLCFQVAQGAWIKQASNTFAWLRDVVFLDEKKGFIAGSRGTFLETNDGGKTWTKRKNFTEDTILQIVFTDTANGWLLCERDIYNRGARASSYLLKTSDGGQNWDKTELTDGGRDRLTKIFFNSRGKGFAIGENGALFQLLDDRQTWEKQLSPIRNLLLDGVFTGEKSGALVGAGGNLLFTEDGGGSWNKATILGNVEGKFNAVFFINQKNGWTAGAGGRILQTFTGGKVWREQNSGVSSDLTDIYFLNTAEGFAVGNDGTILRTTTAGNVWSIENTGLKHRLERVVFTGKKGFAVGFGGTILMFDEAAQSDSTTKPKLAGR